MNSEIETLSIENYKNLSILDRDDLDWLELPKIPEVVDNPFDRYDLSNGPPDPTDEIIKIALDLEYLYFTIRFILNVEAFPFQLSILDSLWTRRYPMLIMTRGGGKTFILALYALLRMVLEPGCKIAGVGSGLRQSRQIFDYMKNIWDKAPVLRDIAGRGKDQGPKRAQDRFQFQVGESIAAFFPIGTGEKIRGIRANYVLIDEFASVPEEIVNVVVRGFAVVNQDVPSRIKHAYRKDRLKKSRLWTDEMEKLEKATAQKNQIVYSGTAYYSFNHFYKYFLRWRKIIASKGDPKVLDEIFGDDQELKNAFDWKDYCILRIPYTQIPKGMLDESIIADARASLTSAQFNCEYCAIFAVDSDGFFKRSILESATTNKPISLNGRVIQFHCKREGENGKKYVMGIDPAADQDNAAIVILEVHSDHRRIVNCWTTNRTKYNQLKKFYQNRNMEIEDDYYRYVAAKVRQLMSLFNIEHIIMDKNGGGIAIAECLGSRQALADEEYPIYPIIDPDDPKPTDSEDGIHILELLSPTSEINSEANHGMLKDFQNKELLFPKFDTVELEKNILLDMKAENEIDTYEDLVDEIEYLKNEITSIVQGSTSNLGKETFDVPKVKTGGTAKGYLRKDRYSALLYANYYVRSKGKKELPPVKYKPVGRLKDSPNSRQQASKGGMYYGFGLAGLQGSSWLKNPNYRSVSRKTD